MSSSEPYSIAIEEEAIVIRADRTVFDIEALVKFFDNLRIESIRRRSQATQAVIDALADAVDRKVWQRLRTQVLS